MTGESEALSCRHNLFLDTIALTCYCDVLCHNFNSGWYLFIVLLALF